MDRGILRPESGREEKVWHCWKATRPQSGTWPSSPTQKTLNHLTYPQYSLHQQMVPFVFGKMDIDSIHIKVPYFTILILSDRHPKYFPEVGGGGGGKIFFSGVVKKIFFSFFC